MQQSYHITECINVPRCPCISREARYYFLQEQPSESIHDATERLDISKPAPLMLENTFSPPSFTQQVNILYVTFKNLSFSPAGHLSGWICGGQQWGSTTTPSSSNQIEFQGKGGCKSLIIHPPWPTHNFDQNWDFKKNSYVDTDEPTGPRGGWAVGLGEQAFPTSASSGSQHMGLVDRQQPSHGEDISCNE